MVFLDLQFGVFFCHFIQVKKILGKIGEAICHSFAVTIHLP